MYERIIEIIVFVVSELKQNKTIGEIDIGHLQTLGYSNAEISTAISWLVDRIEMSEQFLQISSTLSEGSFRILHAAEQEMFTSEAYGEIIHYISLGLIANEHIEVLIERAAMLGSRPVDSAHLKYFIANILFNAQATTHPGIRFMLNSQDVVN